jgi:hypothetical protein
VYLRFPMYRSHFDCTVYSTCVHGCMQEDGRLEGLGPWPQQDPCLPHLPLKPPQLLWTSLPCASSCSSSCCSCACASQDCSAHPRPNPPCWAGPHPASRPRLACSLCLACSRLLLLWSCQCFMLLMVYVALALGLTLQYPPSALAVNAS